MKMRFFNFLLLACLLVTITGCITSNKINSGVQAFQLKRYALAIPLLKEEFNQAKDPTSKSELARYIAESYDLQNQYDNAEDWYKIYRENSLDQQAPLVYAQSLMRNEKYKEAEDVLKKYLQLNRQDRKLVEPLIEACQHVIQDGEEDKKSVHISPFPANSSQSDFDANVIGHSIIFSSTRTDSTFSLLTDWSQEGYAHLWQTDLMGQNLSKYNTFNEKYHVASLTETEDGKTIYFTQCGSDSVGNTDYCGIYRVKKDGENWSVPERIHIYGDTTNNGQAFITPDGKTLYFSSDAPFGYGGKDLYYLNIQKDGSYTEPINLGSRVNTSFDEMFPYISDDGNTLYYSSNNNNSFGALDIFKATKAGRLFTNPEHLPYGLNTGRDDFGLEIIEDKNADTTIAWKGIISSNRQNSANDDLYFVTLKKSTPKALAPALYILEGHVVEKIFADSLNPNSNVLGEQPIPYPLITLSGEKLPADEEGFFTTQLDSGLAYQLQVQKDGYLAVNIDFQTIQIKSKPGDTIYFRQKVVLSKIYQDVEIVLNNIYYDFDKWDIREDAKPTLDSLAKILIENPNIQIELASHTDCRGNEDYNLNLSQKRAESVVRYLISKGVSSDRMTAKGYGESMLVEKCDCELCTEEQHQKNRRTTFKIIKIE